LRSLLRLRHLGAARAALADHLPRRKTVTADTMVHLRETIGWIYRAHDATPDDGLSRGYSLTTGWAASYPETTGYMIPTLFDYSHLTGDREAWERARRMADWELSIQLPSGAIQAGLVDAPSVVPTVFNTGQVIFGWVRAYEETGDRNYLTGCERAADWLVAAQADDGEWRGHQSPLVTSGAVNTYNTRTAWALLEAYRHISHESYLQAATRNIDRALAKQHANGWFPDSCLSDNRQPLLHTVAYTIEGILEAGRLQARQDYVSAAARATDAVLACIRADGSLAGRFAEDWRGTVTWACITGVAQVAVVCFRLFDHTGAQRYLRDGRRLLEFVKSTQDIRTSNLNLRGGVKGSHPHTGGYCPFDYLNWAAKFFADACMLELASADPQGLPHSVSVTDTAPQATSPTVD
jgi:uncharacterized protein YyaL (SSP411 family)